MTLSDLQEDDSEWIRFTGGRAQSSSAMVMQVAQGLAKTTDQVSNQAGPFPSSGWSEALAGKARQGKGSPDVVARRFVTSYGNDAW